MCEAKRPTGQLFPPVVMQPGDNDPVCPSPKLMLYMPVIHGFGTRAAKLTESGDTPDVGEAVRAVDVLEVAFTVTLALEVA